MFAAADDEHGAEARIPPHAPVSAGHRAARARAPSRSISRRPPPQRLMRVEERSLPRAGATTAVGLLVAACARAHIFGWPRYARRFHRPFMPLSRSRPCKSAPAASAAMSRAHQSRARSRERAQAAPPAAAAATMMDDAIDFIPAGRRLSGIAFVISLPRKAMMAD